MSRVRLLGVWLNRFNRCIVRNERINNCEAPRCVLRPARGFGTVSEKEADLTAGRKRGLRAVDVAEKLRREKETKADTTNKVR